VFNDRDWRKIASNYLSSYVKSFFQSAHSSVNDTAWVVTGGFDIKDPGLDYDRDFIPSKATYVIAAANGQVRMEVPLPVAKVHHCQLTLENGNIFVTGGNNEETWFLEWRSKKWQRLRPIPSIGAFAGQTRSKRTTSICQSTSDEEEIVLCERMANTNGGACLVYSIPTGSWRSEVLLSYTSDDYDVTYEMKVFNAKMVKVAGKVFLFDGNKKASGSGNLLFIYQLNEKNYSWQRKHVKEMAFIHQNDIFHVPKSKRPCK